MITRKKHVYTAWSEEGISKRGKRKWRKQSWQSRFRMVYDWRREEGWRRGEARDQARDVSSHNARVLIASLDTRPILVSMGLGVLIAYSITWTFTTGWSLVSNYRSRRHGGMRPGWKLILGARSRESSLFHSLKRKINRIGWTSTVSSRFGFWKVKVLSRVRCFFMSRCSGREE